MSVFPIKPKVHKERACLLAFLMFLNIIVSGQLAYQKLDPSQLLDDGISLFDREAYPASVKLLEQYLSSEDHQFLKSESDLKEAKYHLSLAKFYIHSEKGIVAVNQFIQEYKNDSYASLMYTKLGHYYFNQKEYKKAIKIYNKGNTDLLDQKQAQEVFFKKGYSYFVNKSFAKSKTLFAQVAQRNEYYYSAQYYGAMVEYFQGNFESALKAFKIASKSTEYRKLTPSYIAQIFFVKKQYNELITFGKKSLKEVNLIQKEKIHQLLGQAYFIKGAYKEALPYLEYYERISDKLTEKQFYQLGYTQYSLGHYEKAIPNFKKLCNLDNELAQNASYYLGDCLLKNHNKNGAISAFKKTVNLAYDKELAEEAQWNLAKLSAEAGQDRIAIDQFLAFNKISKYYDKAQKSLSNLFLKTKDYDKALSTIEGFQPMPNKLKAIHEKLLLAKAYQHYNDHENTESLRFFESLHKSQEYQLESLYWTGLIKNEQGKLQDSKNSLNKFLHTPSIENHKHFINALYINGYNNLKTESYKQAGENFETLIKHQDKCDQNILEDSYLRLGDCQFKLGDKSKAFANYNQALKVGHQSIYPIYQKAIIKGLQNEYYDQLVLLEEGLKKYPNTEYSDDALWQMANTLVTLKKDNAAIKAYKGVIQKFKTNSPYHNRSFLRLGLLHYNAGDYEDALSYYKRIYEHNPNTAESREAKKAIEEIYVEEQANSNAYFDFIKSIPEYKESSINQDSILFRTAEVKYQQKKYPAAIEQLSQYINNNTLSLNQTKALYLRAESYAIQEDFSLALKDYDEILKAGHTEYYMDALEKCALISYNHAKAFADAFTYYTLLENETSIVEKSLEAQLGALRSAVRTRNLEAIKAFADKLLSNGFATPDEKFYAKFQKAKVLFEKNRLQESLVLLNEVIIWKDNKLTAEAKYLIALIHYKKAEFGQAEIIAQNAFKESANYPYWVAKNILLLGDIYLANKDLFNAEAAIDAIVENYSDEDDILLEAKERRTKIEQLKAKQNRIETQLETDQLKLDDDSNK